MRVLVLGGEDIFKTSLKKIHESFGDLLEKGRWGTTKTSQHILP